MSRPGARGRSSFACQLNTLLRFPFTLHNAHQSVRRRRVSPLWNVRVLSKHPRHQSVLRSASPVELRSSVRAAQRGRVRNRGKMRADKFADGQSDAHLYLACVHVRFVFDELTTNPTAILISIDRTSDLRDAKISTNRIRHARPRVMAFLAGEKIALVNQTRRESITFVNLMGETYVR